MDKAKGFVLAFYVAIRPPTCRFYADPFKTPSCDSGNYRPARYHFIQDDEAEFGGKRGLIGQAASHWAADGRETQCGGRLPDFLTIGALAGAPIHRL
jgi:hypothetical protein